MKPLAPPICLALPRLGLCEPVIIGRFFGRDLDRYRIGSPLAGFDRLALTVWPWIPCESDRTSTPSPAMLYPRFLRGSSVPPALGRVPAVARQMLTSGHLVYCSGRTC